MLGFVARMRVSVTNCAAGKVVIGAIPKVPDFGIPSDTEETCLVPDPDPILCPPPPPDAGTKHGNHQVEVQTAKDAMILEGYTFVKGADDCQAPPNEKINNRLELITRAAKLIGNDNGEAGLLDKPGGFNCSGFASDIIVFPDGYIYDVINGTADDGQGAGWSAGGCVWDAATGTCPDFVPRWRAAP